MNLKGVVSGASLAMSALASSITLRAVVSRNFPISPVIAGLAFAKKPFCTLGTVLGSDEAEGEAAAAAPPPPRESFAAIAQPSSTSLDHSRVASAAEKAGVTIFAATSTVIGGVCVPEAVVASMAAAAVIIAVEAALSAVLGAP